MVPLETDFEDPYRIILNSIPDGVYAVDLKRRITHFNRAAERITGIPRKEAIGQPCFEVFRSNVCESSCVVSETLANNKPVVNRPVYIIRGDKKRVPISVTTTMLKNADNSVTGGVVIFRDLTGLNKLRKELRKQQSFEDIVSKNAEMLRIFSILPQIAQSRSPLLIEGASGTGKELIARAIHNNSLNKNGPLIAVNCGALPDSLAESELFGYRAGAFTDAKKDKPGRFDQARNGTILLDEIGDISQSLQVKLLRVLEQGKFEPLGATQSVTTNARIVTATNRQLDKMVKAGRFREDLYYRINVVQLTLPKLADRKEDIPLLVDHFIERLNHLTGRNIVGISQEALAALTLYDWPGNVRELENAMEHAFVLCSNDIIQMACLPDRILPTEVGNPILPGMTLKEIEKRAIYQALHRNRWKRVATATELGVDKNTLRRKMIRLGIRQPK